MQPLGNLRLIDFSYSTQLVKIPDLSRATRLEHIDLSYCKSLVEIPPLKFRNVDGLKSKGDLGMLGSLLALGGLHSNKSMKTRDVGNL